MAAVRNFEDLLAWQACSALCDKVFEITAGPAGRDVEFLHQIRNAAKKPPALIAEGFLRWTAPEFVRYLRMARGELGEVLNYLAFARRQKYCFPADLDTAERLARRALAITTLLLKSKLRSCRDGVK
jgi:four helix bundle protein